MIIAIIPARSGSKRIKNKNIKKFNGKPIISYPIKILKKTKLFNNIFTSTDSKLISKISVKYGSEIPFLRNKSLADDKSGIIEVIKNFLQNLAKKNKIIPNYVCCVLPTAVFIKPNDILSAYRILRTSKNIDYVFSGHSIDSSFYRSFKLSKMRPNMLFPKNYYKNSQDLPKKIFIDSGQFYFARTQVFLNNKKVFQKRSKVFQLNHDNVIDINTLQDWKKAEKILK